MLAAGFHIMLAALSRIRGQLIVNTPEKFFSNTGVEVHTGMEAVSGDPVKTVCKVINLTNGEVSGKVTIS